MLKSFHQRRYVEDEDEYEEEVNNTHYHYRLTHKDYAAIPQGKQISVVRLEGVMMRDEAWCEPGTRDIAKWLRQGDADPRVLANIVLIPSTARSKSTPNR